MDFFGIKGIYTFLFICAVISLILFIFAKKVK
jgi:hypothetical protein